MATFRFRLEKLMELRRAIRSQRRVELAEAREIHQSLQRQRDAIDQERQHLEQAIRQWSHPGNIPLDQLLAASRHASQLRARFNQLRKRCEQATKEVEHRRDRLLDAEREYRVLENLRNRQRSDHRQRLTKQEQGHFDEIALLQATPNVKAGEAVKKCSLTLQSRALA